MKQNGNPTTNFTPRGNDHPLEEVTKEPDHLKHRQHGGYVILCARGNMMWLTKPRILPFTRMSGLVFVTLIPRTAGPHNG